MSQIVHKIPTELLREIGEALYGPNWIAPLGAALNISERTMRRVAAGTVQLNMRALDELLLLIDQKEMRLAFLRGKIMRAKAP